MNRMTIVLLLTVMGWATPRSFAQGCVGFANSPLMPIIDGRTGEPAAADSGVKVGMYYSPNPNASTEAYQLAAVTPIIDAGVFVHGGASGSTPVCFDGISPGDDVHLIIKAWTGGYGSYEEALADPNTWLGTSEPLWGAVAAPGSPPPALVSGLGFRGFTLVANIPEPSSWLIGLLGGFGMMLLARRLKRIG